MLIRRSFSILLAIIGNLSNILMIVSSCIACGTLHAQEVAPVGEAQVVEVNFLAWLIEVSGAIGILIFILSIYFGSVVIRSFVELRSKVTAPPDIVSEADGYIQTRDTKALLELLNADDSFFSRTLQAGISELKYGLDEAREKLERFAESLTNKMERSISILAILGTLGPMIGLLGTLKGMIASFSVIAMSGVALDAAQVAEGISEALVLTFEGVALSVPSIYFYSLFRNRISVITEEATILADDRLRDLARVLSRQTA